MWTSEQIAAHNERIKAADLLWNKAMNALYLEVPSEIVDRIRQIGDDRCKQYAIAASMAETESKGMHMNWKLTIHRDRDGVITGRLSEDGKMDTITTVTEEQLPWFNALQNLIEGRA